MSVPIGDEKEKLEKDQSTLEMVAYRDTWGRGTDSYLSMMYERFVLIKELLSSTGSVFVHTDWHVGHLIQSLLEDVFGKKRFLNQIVWWYVNKLPTGGQLFDRQHDVILSFSLEKSINSTKFVSKANTRAHSYRQKRSEVFEFPVIDPETGKQVRVMSSDKPCGDVWRMNMIHALRSRASRVCYSEAGGAY